MSNLNPGAGGTFGIPTKTSTWCVRCQGCLSRPDWFLFWTGWTVEITGLVYLNCLQIGYVLRTFQLVLDQRITSVLFRFRILRASPPKKLPKHGGNTISTISKPKHFSIYSCKTSYTSSTVQPKILPILFPRHLQDVGLHELPKLAAWLPSHESSLNVRCYLPWEKICRKHVASKGFHSTLKNQTTKLVNWLWRDLRKPYQTRSQEESKIQIH